MPRTNCGNFLKFELCASVLHHLNDAGDKREAIVAPHQGLKLHVRYFPVEPANLSDDSR
jgi:hypothetical protein